METGIQYDEEFKKQAVKLAMSEVRKEERLKLISLKNADGRNTGKISFFCRALDVLVGIPGHRKV